MNKFLDRSVNTNSRVNKMDMYQEYCSVIQDEILYECDQKDSNNAFCECGEYVHLCKNAYDHMSNGC